MLSDYQSKKREKTMNKEKTVPISSLLKEVMSYDEVMAAIEQVLVSIEESGSTRYSLEQIGLFVQALKESQKGFEIDKMEVNDLIRALRDVVLHPDVRSIGMDALCGGRHLRVEREANGARLMITRLVGTQEDMDALADDLDERGIVAKNPEKS